MLSKSALVNAACCNRLLQAWILTFQHEKSIDESNFSERLRPCLGRKRLPAELPALALVKGFGSHSAIFSIPSRVFWAGLFWAIPEGIPGKSRVTDCA